MSLAPKEIKSNKRIVTMGSGTHCAMIAKIFYLQNAAKEDILADGKHKIMVVQFKDGSSRIHEQHYAIDGAWRQDNLKKMFSTAQVVGKDGGRPTSKDAIGKRLWISIREIHFMDDGTVVNDIEGNPKIDYQIFKIAPFIDGGKKPAIVGDPADNDGTPLEPFIAYKNVHMEEPHHVQEVAPARTIQNTTNNFLNEKPEVPVERENEEPTF